MFTAMTCITFGAKNPSFDAKSLSRGIHPFMGRLANGSISKYSNNRYHDQSCLENRVGRIASWRTSAISQRLCGVYDPFVRTSASEMHTNWFPERAEADIEPCEGQHLTRLKVSTTFLYVSVHRMVMTEEPRCLFVCVVRLGWCHFE